MSKKFKLPLLLTVLVALALVAVAPATTIKAQKPNLQIIWFAWQPCDLLTKLAKDYADANVETRCVPLNQWHDQIFTDFAAKGGADLVILDSQFIGEAVVGGHVIDLTDWEKANMDMNDYSPYSLSAYGEYPPASGKYYGVPIEQDAQLGFYRKDLFDNKDVQADFKAKTGEDLKTPATWSDLLEIAKFFKGSKYVKNGFVTHWKGKGGYDEVSTAWDQVLWSFGGDLWDPKTYKVEGVLNTDAGVKALQYEADLFKTAPDGAGDFSFNETIDAVCNGSTAMSEIWFAFMPNLVGPNSWKQANNIGFYVTPGEVKHFVSLGGMGIHVSSYTKNKDATLAFLKWLESKDTQTKWASGGGFTARLSILSSDVFLKATPYNKYFGETVPLLKDFWNLPEYAAMLDVEQEYVNAAITGQMDPKAALDEIAKRHQAILDKAYPNGPPKGNVAVTGGGAAATMAATATK